MNKIVEFIKKKNSEFLRYNRDKEFFKGNNIKLYNWYEKDSDFWLCRFVRERELIPENKTLSFFSVFGYRYNIYLDNSD